MATSQTWKLKRYGRFVQRAKLPRGKPWEVFEAKGNKPEIVLTLLECGYLLIAQGQESLDTIPLLQGLEAPTVQHKSDNLILRFTVKGETRMIRMQFDGSSTAEAINQCSSAVEKLMVHVPVTTQGVASVQPNQPPTEVPAPGTQPSCQEKTAGTGEREVVQGTLSIKRLAQHFLGDTPVALPQMYNHSSLAEGDLEPFLRVCLLDPSFPAFVEKVEEELKKLLKD
ncbi:meiotic recombination protein REC114 [Austrofundulus limnaeus]|uniref:Meiotic recombination protein REC114 n=1 Tax=Austrofundulus limnaeus TaxID=52670 RepID=A0A2I4CLX9_AUSLI|nr:PREDICTED: meiotic recombination protein REC114 [Austrofundulus limnaeus]